jgi:N-acetyl sugar amidotransferase
MANLSVKYGLPEKIEYCQSCTFSNQRPSSSIELKNKNENKKKTISFENGICDACKFALIKEKEINWKNREQELLMLLDKHRSKNGSYDCIVPGSGGKDSVFVSHILKNKYNMNPLTVTWAPHMYTDTGHKNFINWINSGVDNILCTPNGDVHRKLTKLAFHNLCHPFQPFIIGQKQIGPRMADKFNVPLVFYGDNPAEHGNSIEDNFKAQMDIEFFTGEKDYDNIILGGVHAKNLINQNIVNIGDLNPYLPISKQICVSKNIQVHYLSYYLRWDPQECYYYALSNANFIPNPSRTEGSYSKYSSLDDKLDCLHYYTTYIKFGIGRATYDSSQEIRNRKITRNEGIALVKKYDGEKPNLYLSECLEYLDINEDQFWRIIDNARSEHIWKKTNQGWELRKQIY